MQLKIKNGQNDRSGNSSVKILQINVSAENLQCSSPLGG